MLSRLNRVIAIGRDTYLRFYPNPGIGLCLGRRRFALSLWRGFESFRRDEATGGWQLRSRRFNMKLASKKG